MSTKFVAFLPYRLAFSRSILKAPQLSSRIPNTILPMFSCYRPQQLHPSFYSSFPVTDYSSYTLSFTQAFQLQTTAVTPFLLLKLSRYRLQQLHTSFYTDYSSYTYTLPFTFLLKFSSYRPQQLQPSFYSSFPVTDYSSYTLPFTQAFQIQTTAVSPFLLLKLSRYRPQQLHPYFYSSFPITLI